MARPSDNSLKYFSLDTKDQDNLQYVEAVHNHIGFSIVIKLFQHIYGGAGGYYCEWTDLNKRLFCKKNGTTLEVLDGIIGTCCGAEIGIFDANMVQQHHILTSDGIQKRWLSIVKQVGRKNCQIVDKYRLIEIDTTNNTTGTGDTHHIAPQETPPAVVHSSTETPQIKRKEIKGKENSIEGNGTIPTPPHGTLVNTDGKKIQTRKPAPEFPQSAADVEKYMYQKMKNRWDPGFINLAANKFYDHYTSNDWKQSKGCKIVNWHSAANMWIYRDLEKQGPPVYKAPTPPPPPPPSPVHTPAPVALSPEQIQQKAIDFSESIYQEYCHGTVKEDGLPASIYDQLRDKGLLVLSEDRKDAILKEVGMDIVKAKKKSLAIFFDKLKQIGKQCVYETEEITA